jgi:hypothetical protein
MAVVRLKYIRGKQQIKAHLRYITHRRGKTQEKITRLLFGRDGLTDKRAAYEMIDSAKRGTAFFKIMISPDPRREDTYRDLDLQHITRQTLLRLEKQLGRHFQFVATVHNDHAPHRHVHGIFFSKADCPKKSFERCKRPLTGPPPSKPTCKEKPRIEFGNIPATAPSITISRKQSAQDGRGESTNRFVVNQAAALAGMAN